MIYTYIHTYIYTQAQSRHFCEGKYAISADAGIIWTGHSNGGYGALLYGVLNPGRTRGVAPLSGMPVLGMYVCICVYVCECMVHFLVCHFVVCVCVCVCVRSIFVCMCVWRP